MLGHGYSPKNLLYGLSGPSKFPRLVDSTKLEANIWVTSEYVNHYKWYRLNLSTKHEVIIAKFIDNTDKGLTEYTIIHYNYTR